MDEYVPLRLEDIDGMVKGCFIVYHNCQLPDQLSIATMLPAPIYATDDVQTWNSPHLEDTETYSLSIRVERLLVIRLKESFEHFKTGGGVEKLLAETGADAIGYIPLGGDETSRQIYLTNAAEQITAVRRLGTAPCWGLKNALLAVVGVPAMEPLQYRAMALYDNDTVTRMIDRAGPRNSRFHILSVLSPTSLLVQYVERKAQRFLNNVDMTELDAFLEELSVLFKKGVKNG